MPIRRRPMRVRVLAAVVSATALATAGWAVLQSTLAHAASQAVTQNPLNSSGQNISGTWGVGGANALSGHFAGLLRAQINGVPAQMYCIDLAHPISSGLTLDEKDWNDAIEGTLDSNDLPKIATILGNAYPNENPAFALAGTADDKSAAVQAAIWHYSDEFTLDPNAPATVKDNYNSILAWVEGTNGVKYPSANQAPPTMVITPAAKTGTVGQAIGPFSLATTASPGTVALVPSNGTSLVNADGSPWTGDPNGASNGANFYLRRTTAGSGSVTASATATAGSGRVFIHNPADGTAAQKLILATRTTAPVTASAAAAFVPASQVQVQKSATGGGTAQAFSFVLTGGGLPGNGVPIGVTVTSNTPVLSDPVGDLVAGQTYTITEVNNASWVQVPGSCTNAEAVKVSGVSITFTVPAAGNAQIVCSFTNTRLARISITKVTDPPNNPATFGFTLTGPGTAAGAPSQTKPATGDGKTQASFDNLAPGTYKITENPGGPNWRPDKIDCGDAFPVAADGTITVPAGAVITCVAGNTLLGQITIVKATVPANVNQDFGVSVTGPGGPFTGVINDGANKTMALTHLGPGTYTISENTPLPVGWKQTAIACAKTGATTAGFTASSTSASTASTAKTASAASAAGSTATTKAAATTATTKPAAPATTTATTAKPAAVTTPTTAATKTAAAAAAAAATASTRPNLGKAASEQPAPQPNQVTLSPGEQWTCTITNTQGGQIIVAKLTNGGDGTFSYTGTGLGGRTQGITTSAGKGSLTGLGVDPGSYTITESPLSGWRLTGITCDNAQSTGDVNSSTATYNINPGQTVTCTFTNLKETASISLSKTPSPTSLNVGDTVTYTFVVTNTGSLPLTNVTLVDQGGDISLGPITLGKTTLAPGESTSGTAKYVAKSSDAGRTLINTAVVKGTQPNGSQLTATAQARIIVNNVRALTTTPGGTGAGQLPRTGRDSGHLFRLGLATLMAGFGLVLLTRDQVRRVVSHRRRRRLPSHAKR